MLLETLDVKQNDIIIYSRNRFDFESNFSILFKDEPQKKAVQIGYGEVCRYVDEFIPKSLIVYRLLTNLGSHAITRSKYGFFINISGINELIYFDPVFALKEMEEYINETSNFDLRFRIQQVGLTTLTRRDRVSNYAEIYSIDLTVPEALNQDDKAFVDALLTSMLPAKAADEEEQPASGDALRRISYGIREDAGYDLEQLTRINKNGNSDNGQQANGKPAVSPPGSFGEFLRRKAAGQKPPIEEDPGAGNPMVDIFKSSDSLERALKGKKNMQIVLKLEKND